MLRSSQYCTFLYILDHEAKLDVVAAQPIIYFRHPACRNHDVSRLAKPRFFPKVKVRLDLKILQEFHLLKWELLCSQNLELKFLYRLLIKNWGWLPLKKKWTKNKDVIVTSLKSKIFCWRWTSFMKISNSYCEKSDYYISNLPYIHDMICSMWPLPTQQRIVQAVSWWPLH